MAEEQKEKSTNLTSIILVILLMVASFLAGLSWTKIKGEKQSNSQESNQMTQATPTQSAILGEEFESANIGRFVKTKDEVCQENGKLIVYMFGSSSCPHCTWEHPIFEKVVAKFGSLIVVHDNMDKQEADEAIWQKYSQISQGSIPFVLLGCRYAQRGSGDKTAGEAQEEKNITALICKLTDNQPQKVCAEVSQLISQIAD